MTIRRILGLFFVIMAGAAPAQSGEFGDLYARLARHGFENLRIAATADSGLAIAFENRVYRHDLKAVGEMLKLAGQADSTWQRLYIIPCSRGVARGQIMVLRAAYRAFMDGSMDAPAFSRTLVIGEATQQPEAAVQAWQNRSFFKLDLNVTFGHQIQLGQYDDRVKLYGQVQPGLRSQLWHGTLVQAEAFIPVFDEIGVYDTGARLGRLSVSQLLRLPRDSYLALQGGIFMPERWGFSGETAKFWLGRRVLTGIKLDYTGFFYHSEGTWYYSNMDSLTYKVYAQYFLPSLDMMVGIDYSKYLIGDKGPCFTLRRTFSETDIELYYAVTNLDRFGGVRFRFPLPTQQRMRPARVRLTWPSQYGMSYQATSEATRYEGVLQTGLSVDPGFAISEFVKPLTPAHVLANIKGWREGDDTANE
ncbi:MAG TPA: YjbH domain-containing protein [bacterium]|nr:YjbH domain-containing protein [bacterium]HQI48054.1 YjbH domain-containing protein [bacterium]HQJ65972.1 YjbH domain-containing protein [bacterium]